MSSSAWRRRSAASAPSASASFTATTRKGALVLVVALIASMFTVFAPVQAAPAAAESNPPTTAAVGLNTFYTYVAAGEGIEVAFRLPTRSATNGQTFTLTDPSGAVRWTCEIPVGAAAGTVCAAPAGLTGPAGIWTLDAVGTGTVIANWPEGTGVQTTWTISALAANGAPIPGRVWTKQHRAFSSGLTDLGFWVVTGNGAQYKLDLPGFNGVGWSLNSDAFGNVTVPDGCTPAYRSMVNTINTPEHQGPGDQCGEGYNLFFQQPADDLPASAPSAAGELFVVPEYVAPSITDAAFTPTSPVSRAGTLAYDLNDFTGSYVIRIDTDGNGSYDDAGDLEIAQSGAAGAATYEWDGLDAAGAPVDVCTAVNFEVAIDRTDEVHFVLGDVEFLGGIRITQLAGSSIGNDVIYWDDTDVPNSGGAPKTSTTSPIVNLDGLSSASGTVHGWPGTGGNPWGNFASIDNWTYSPVDISAEATAPGTCLTVEKSSDATEDTRPGDEVTYTVTATNNGTDDYTEANPAVVSDDLTGVLDDAELDLDSIAATVGGADVAAPTFDSPKLSWSGPLEAGETVTLTYTVTVTGEGDRVVRNIAYAGTPDLPTPVCEPPVGGVDPDTGIPCATTSFELPRLQVLKSADSTELPAEGDELTYTVVVTNPSATDYTATAPATMTDDLSDVLDDATIDEDSFSATAGEVSYADGVLSWSGPISAGESVTITYTVIYTGSGDQVLRNEACVPADQVTAPDLACDVVRVPGAALSQWKVSTPSSDPLAAGSTIRYTLYFDNDGQADAAVDAVDDLTHVTDDADVTVEPSSPNGLIATRDGDRISITGSVPAGATYTVSYTVTLRSDAERGDNIAANFLLAPDEVPPTEPVCVPDDAEPDCTVNLIPEIVDSKSVTPVTGTTVEPGQELTYTLTFENIGEAAGPVDRVDDLTHILDDAEVTVAPAASDDALTVSPIADGRFSITGELAVGHTVTVTYTVTVNASDELGDTELANFLLNPDDPTPQTPGECAPSSEDCTYNPVPRMEDSKSVTPASGATVVPGDELTYTLTFENTSTVPASVDRVDDLTHILDDAHVTVVPAASDAALTVSDIIDGRFTITGELAAGQTVTVTYSVVVNPNDELGDAELGNFLLDPEDPTPQTPGECAPGSEDCTYNPAPLLVDAKSVDPASGTPVVSDQELTYTLTFRNDGAAAGAVDKVDDLTHVLDDGDVIVEPTASDEALTATRDGARIAITGTLQAGQEVTVTYTVQVRASAERGDDILANFLLLPDAPTPETPGACEPDSEDCTFNPVGDIVPAKSVDPSTGTTVTDGAELTYTLSFENVGEGAAVVDYTDYMRGVLDDAQLVGTPQASDGLSVSGPTGGELRITGSLEAGQSATVTYTVRVKAYDQQGNHQLANFLTPAGQEPPTTCVATNPLCTQNPIDPPPPGLAVTGGEIAAWVLITGLMLLVGGGGVLLYARRRREETVDAVTNV